MTKPVNSILATLRPHKIAKKPPRRPFIQRQAQVFKLGKKILDGQSLTDQERRYLGGALQLISKGHDPFQALDLETDKPGQTRSNGFMDVNRKTLAVAWIAAATEKDENGKAAMTVSAAIEKAADVFDLAPSTMKKIWNEGPRELIVKLL